jgi:hypothetical protein
MATGIDIANTTTHPVYASKAALLADLNQMVATNSPSQDEMFHILARLSNTTTSGWADPTARHDA